MLPLRLYVQLYLHMVVIPLFFPCKEGTMRKLTKKQKRDIAAIAAKTDADIDFPDIPLQRDWSGAEIGKFYRPGKKPVTLRLDTDVIKWLKADGRGYQTKAN